MAVLLKNRPRPRWLAVLSLSLLTCRRGNRYTFLPTTARSTARPLARQLRGRWGTALSATSPAASADAEDDTARPPGRLREGRTRRRRSLQLREERRERERESQPGERTILAAAAAGRSSDWPKTDAPTDGQTDGERRGRGERCRHPRRKEGRNGGTSGRRWDEEGRKSVYK